MLTLPPQGCRFRIESIHDARPALPAKEFPCQYKLRHCCSMRLLVSVLTTHHLTMRYPPRQWGLREAAGVASTQLLITTFKTCHGAGAAVAGHHMPSSPLQDGRSFFNWRYHSLSSHSLSSVAVGTVSTEVVNTTCELATALVMMQVQLSPDIIYRHH